MTNFKYVYQINKIEELIEDLKVTVHCKVGIVENNTMPMQVIEKKLILSFYEIYQRLSDLQIDFYNDGDKFIYEKLKIITKYLKKVEKYVNFPLTKNMLYNRSNEIFIKIDSIMNESKEYIGKIGM